MKWNLKSIISLIITVVLAFAFGYTVVRMLDNEMAKSIVTAFLTIATSVIGFYIGYQTNKTSQSKDDEENIEKR